MDVEGEKYQIITTLDRWEKRTSPAMQVESLEWAKRFFLLRGDEEGQARKRLDRRGVPGEDKP